MPSLMLNERAVVRIKGPDAENLSQDVLTPDLEKLGPDEALPGALLTPQGKIMFDFVISRDGGDEFILDMDRAHAADFSKRMMLYRLRAKADITLDEATRVAAVWDEEAPAGARRDLRFRDGRVVHRVYGKAADSVDVNAYTWLRIEAGVAESGHDYALSDAFPHDVLMDLNGGLSFRKGCFVGQEVVSRMQHRGAARRRLVKVSAPSPLAASKTPITTAGKPIGALGSVVDGGALAIVRVDRVGTALKRGAEIEAGGVPVSVTLPEWTGLAFAAGED